MQVNTRTITVALTWLTSVILAIQSPIFLMAVISVKSCFKPCQAPVRGASAEKNYLNSFTLYLKSYIYQIFFNLGLGYVLRENLCINLNIRLDLTKVVITDYYCILLMCNYSQMGAWRINVFIPTSCMCTGKLPKEFSDSKYYNTFTREAKLQYWTKIM